MDNIFLPNGSTIFKKVLLITLLWSYPALALAARPLSTDDAATVEQGHWEIETGFEYVNDADDEYTWSAALKYGLAQRWDAGIEIPYLYIDVAEGDDQDGLSDITFCTKYNFWDEGEGLPAFSLGASIKTDSGDDEKGLGSGEMDYGFTVIFSKTLGEIAAHLNLGYTSVGVADDNHDDLFGYALALELPVNENLNLVGELSGESNFESDFDDNPFSGLIGFNYAFSQIVTFDLGIGWGISDASSDYTITSGLTLGF